MLKNALSAADLAEVMSLFTQGLATHQKTVNALNVFPVPDGDTGTNMLATMRSVLTAIEELGPDPSMQNLCAAIAKGSLMGARGNSGVILCQILRGLAGDIAQHQSFGATELTAAYVHASAVAREAVLRPVEGTILSVARAAAEAVQSLKPGDLVASVEAARQGAVKALARTPSQLPVLAQAGVVDAGGAGLLLLYEAFSSVASGEPMPAELDLPASVAALVKDAAGPPELIATSEESSELLTYEVMYLLDADDTAIADFKTSWATIGDSIVVVGGDGLWNCHIHTNDIGAAIEAGIAVGRPRSIRVTDLTTEVEEQAWVREAGVGEGDAIGASRQAAVTSVLAVATGDGIARVFSSLGVQKIVEGGQSMNPSTEEILRAIEELPSDEVVVLPNNSNILAVARQVVGLSDKCVVVVETAGVQEGFAALLAYDPGSSAQANGEAMAKAARNVVAGEVTQAVRAAPSPAGSVSVGDWIGLSRTGIEAVGPSLSEATCGLLEVLIEKGQEIVTLIEGESCPRPEIEKVLEFLAARHPELSVERLFGGQPLYPLLVSIE